MKRNNDTELLINSDNDMIWWYIYKIMSKIRDGEDLWQWSQLEIRLNAFRRLTMPQKQFIIIIIFFYVFPLVIFKFAVKYPNNDSLFVSENVDAPTKVSQSNDHLSSIYDSDDSQASKWWKL